MKKQLRQKKQKSLNNIDLLTGKLLYDQVLIEPIILDKSVNGLVNAQQYEDKPEFGKVLLVGNGRLLDTGTVISPIVKVGDVVLFQKYSAQKIRVNGIDYLIVREEDVYWIK